MECRLADPFAIDFDRQGNAYICEMTNNRVVKVDTRGELTLFAGTTRKGSGGDKGNAIAAELNGPHHLIVDRRGDVLIADTWNWKIRRVEVNTGRISTFAGSGVRGFAGDGGPAVRAQFSGVYSLSMDEDGKNLYIADLENRRVRAINLGTMVVRTVAGNGQRGVPADGVAAVDAPLLDPRAVATGPDGRLYILERGGHALRVVDGDGRIRTVVGTGKPGPYTEKASPENVTLRGPKHLCVDLDRSVLIVDSENDVIRRYVPQEGRMSRVMGTGKRGAAFAQNPFEVQLGHPHGVNVDRLGNVYVCDSNNGRVLMLTSGSPGQ